MYLIAHYLLPTSSYVYTILFFFHVGQTCVDGQTGFVTPSSSFFVNAVQPYGEGGATKDSNTGTA